MISPPENAPHFAGQMVLNMRSLDYDITSRAAPRTVSFAIKPRGYSSQDFEAANDRRLDATSAAVSLLFNLLS